MSLVESWPSTEMRSNERLTQTPSSRSAVSACERRVGLHEAEHRREAGLDHPRALGLGADRAPCPTAARRRASAASRTRPWWRSRARTRRRRPAPARRGRRASRAGRRPSASARRSRRSTATATCSSCTPAAIAAAPCMRAASSRPRLPVAAFALPELTTTARSASSRQRVWHSSTGAASTPERVKRAALTVPGSEQTSSPRSGSPDGLIPAAHAGGAEAGGQPAARDARSTRAGRLDPARGERLTQALALVAPEHHVEVLHRLRGGALPQVVDRREDEDPARARRRCARRCGSSWSRAPRARRAGRAAAPPTARARTRRRRAPSPRPRRGRARR